MPVEKIGLATCPNMDEIGPVLVDQLWTIQNGIDGQILVCAAKKSGKSFLGRRLDNL